MFPEHREFPQRVYGQNRSHSVLQGENGDVRLIYLFIYLIYEMEQRVSSLILILVVEDSLKTR